MPDKPFVVKFHIYFEDGDDDEDDLLDYEGPTAMSIGDTFLFYITTRRLIEFSESVIVLQAADTYKLNWIGAPTMLVGTSDINRHLHGIGLACCTREANKDYKFILNCVALGKELIYD